MQISTLSPKGQITLPESICRHLRIEPGDQLGFYVDAEGRVHLEPAERRRRGIHELRGLLHRPGQKPVSVEEMNEGIAEHLAWP